MALARVDWTWEVLNEQGELVFEFADLVVECGYQNSPDTGPVAVFSDVKAQVPVRMASGSWTWHTRELPAWIKPFIVEAVKQRLSDPTSALSTAIVEAGEEDLQGERP